MNFSSGYKVIDTKRVWNGVWYKPWTWRQYAIVVTINIDHIAVISGEVNNETTMEKV